MSQLEQVQTADYDKVGQYTQDSINGLTDELLDKMLDLVAPEEGLYILDAMGGDGNLTRRLSSYCEKRNIPFPRTSLFEFSKVQCEFALVQMPKGSDVIWGDILTMSCLETKMPLEEGIFDRIMIKSAIHEIPKEDQERLCSNLYRLLKPGGLLINLGFLLENEVQQKEVRELARVKDTLASMSSAAERRYFTTRDELYRNLEKAGFVDVEAGERFDYQINSRIVAEQYFSLESRQELDLEYQAAHIKASHLRQSGRIHFDSEDCLLQLPGEVTVARKPVTESLPRDFFTSYPYEFMRSIRVHSDMLSKTANQIPQKSSLLDLGCGPGLLTERLVDHDLQSYTGVDVSGEFIALCSERFSDQKTMGFVVSDVNQFPVEPDRYDTVALLNILNLEGVQPVPLLRKIHNSLKDEGKVIVTGPTSEESFGKAEELILTHLKEDGFLEKHRDDYLALKRANQKILSSHANYWSEEGMVELLNHLGFGTVEAFDNGLYHGLCYLIVAKKS